MIAEEIQENFPFLTVIDYGGEEYIGIVVNQDQWVTSLYQYTKLRSREEKKRFLELGEVWWWQSNRSIPISIFLREEMDDFDYAIISLSTRDVSILAGPMVNMGSLATKRIKRRNVRLVRPPR